MGRRDPLYGLTQRQAGDLAISGEATRQVFDRSIGVADGAAVEAVFRAANQGMLAVLPASRNWQLVEITGSISGDLYPGVWKLTNEGVLESQEEIRVKSVSGQTLTTGRYYLAFFSHYENEFGVFQVPDSPGSGGAGDSNQLVNCTSATSTLSGSGWTVYPGKATAWFFETWFDFYDLWIVPMNGGAPSVQRYLGTAQAVDPIDGKIVVVV